MKSFFLILSILLGNKLYGAVGCRTGNNIYTLQKSGQFVIEGSSSIPIYFATSAIHIRNGPTDNQCGILRSKSDSYTKVMGTQANPNSKCAYDSNIGDQGTLVNYFVPDNNCPIDDYIHFMILATGGLGFFYLRRNRNVIPIIR